MLAGCYVWLRGLHKTSGQILGCCRLVSFRTLVTGSVITTFSRRRGKSRLAGHLETHPGHSASRQKPLDAAAPPSTCETGPRSPETREPHRRPRRAAADQKMGSKQQVPDGMIIGPKNPIIEEALGDRLVGGKREAAELSVADFDGSRWKLVCTPDQPHVATVHLDVGGWAEIEKVGGRAVLESLYAGMVVEPAPTYPGRRRRSRGGPLPGSRSGAEGVPRVIASITIPLPVRRRWRLRVVRVDGVYAESCQRAAAVGRSILNAVPLFAASLGLRCNLTPLFFSLHVHNLRD